MYTQQEIARITELFNQIEKNKAHEYAAPTYKDRPALIEMEQIIAAHSEETLQVLEEKIQVLWYLAKSYDQMFRFGISVKFHKQLLESHAKLMKLREYSAKDKRFAEDSFYNAVKARNQYFFDGCDDLREIVSEVISKEDAEKTLNGIIKSRKGLPKNDPVELTDEYLAVIDQVEEKIEKNKKIDLCHEYWNLKSEYLMEHGIAWSSPAVLNPGFMFD